MTTLGDAKRALSNYEKSMDAGCPSLPEEVFTECPGLDRHVLSALHEFVRVCRVAEQVKPARRVSLTEVESEGDAGVADQIG